MNKFLAASCILIIAATIVTARPSNNIIYRQKRQSDQRLAELETLLALHKYGHHRHRGHKDTDDSFPPGFGLIDFNKIGRRKKSTRFSPEEPEDEKAWSSWVSISSDPRNPTSLDSGIDQK